MPEENQQLLSSTPFQSSPNDIPFSPRTDVADSLPIPEISEESISPPEIAKEELPQKKKGFFSRFFRREKKKMESGSFPAEKNDTSNISQKVFPLEGINNIQSEEDLLKSISDRKGFVSDTQSNFSKKILLEETPSELIGESTEILEKKKKEEMEKNAERNARNFLIMSQSVVLFVVVLALVIYGIFSAILDSEGIFVKVFPNNYGIQKKNLSIELETEEKQINSMNMEISKNDNLIKAIKDNNLLEKIKKNKIDWVQAIDRLSTVAKTAPTIGTTVRFDSYSSKTGTRELIVQGRIDVPSGKVFLEIGKLIDAFNGIGVRSEMTKYFSGAKLLNFSKIKNEEEGTEAASMTFNFTLQYYPEGRDSSEIDTDEKNPLKK